MVRSNNRNQLNLSDEDMTRIVASMEPAFARNNEIILRRVRTELAPEEASQARAADNINTLVRKLQYENKQRDRQSLYDKALAHFNGKFLPDFMNSAHFAHTLAGLFALFMVEDLRLVSKLIADEDTADEGLTMLEKCILNALEAQRKAEFACESFTSSATLIEPWKEAVTYRDRINTQTFIRCRPGTVWDDDAVKANAAWLREEVKNAQSRLDIARLRNPTTTTDRIRRRIYAKAKAGKSLLLPLPLLSELTTPPPTNRLWFMQPALSLLVRMTRDMDISPKCMPPPDLS